MRCTVFGTGYLGATHAAGMAEIGHDVIGVDIDEGKVAKLASGDIPFYEPGLRKMLSDNLAAGRLRFTTDYDQAAEFADVHFLGVGTPQKKGEYGADLRHVHSVIDTLVPQLRRPAVIVGKSTVPVGTAAEAEAGVEEATADSRVVAKRVGQQSDVGVDGLAHLGDRVDERDLGGEKGVRGHLDQFGRLKVGDQKRHALGE